MKKADNKDIFLTVFTPAFNRAHTLPRTYYSLLSQSNKNFIWLIIDDGSTDNTAELVKEWQKSDNGFEIRYIYKKNGGMHTAHNTAYENIDTELNVCIDSDDKLAEGAVEIIYNTWKKISDKNYAGIIGLDAAFNGDIIGKKFDYDGMETTLYGWEAYGGKEDKKLIYRTDVMNSYPSYPEFEGEKLVALSYKYLLCDQDYKLYAINEVICNVEYQIDGSTNNMWKQRFNNPKGFAFFKKIRMQYPTTKIGLFKDTIHYISSCIIGKNRGIISNSPQKLLTVLLFPFGILLSVYTRFKAKR